MWKKRPWFEASRKKRQFCIGEKIKILEKKL
jgi:hypothetical protein